MKDAYTSMFFDRVKETTNETGLVLPEDVESYVVMLLASKVEQPDFLPNGAFALEYLTLSPVKFKSAKDLGDTCLFVSGVFPLYGSKHGIQRSYYQGIGASSYLKVSESMNNKLFTTLAQHFEFLSEFIEIVVHNTNFTKKEL